MSINDAEGFVYELKGRCDERALGSMVLASSRELARVPDMREHADILSRANISANLVKLFGAEFLKDPEVARLICAIRVSLSDLEAKIGLGLISLTVAPIDQAGNVVEFSEGSKPSKVNMVRGGRREEMVRACFNTEIGFDAELIIPVTDEVPIRAMSAGHDLASGGPGTMPKLGKRAILAGDQVSLVVRVLEDMETFEDRGIRYGVLGKEDRRVYDPSVYFRRFLTSRDVRKITCGLPYYRVPDGVIPWDKLQTVGY